ncbi:HNH endonuclease [Bifidobacterium aquikefiri]|uniref:HNH endonuclease n=2 Tax=Bifidobacterium aquikefiri TaxID=1653207 RepID=UPI0039E91B1E
MPTRPQGRCTEPGCTNKATYRGRCDEHQDTWIRQSKHTQRINQALWNRVRRQALRRDHNTCVMCGQPGNEVDHIREVADNGSLYDLNNLQTLCHVCHLQKSYRVSQMRRMKNNQDKQTQSITQDIWEKYGLESK